MARTIHDFFDIARVAPGWTPLTSEDTMMKGDRYINQTTGLANFVCDFEGMKMSVWIDKPHNQMRSWVYRESAKFKDQSRRRLSMNPIFSAPLPLP
jgi:hypothetical protein